MSISDLVLPSAPPCSLELALVAPKALFRRWVPIQSLRFWDVRGWLYCACSRCSTHLLHPPNPIVSPQHLHEQLEPVLLRYSALASKWEFEQMGIWPQNSLQVIREQMGIRANGNVPRKIMQNDWKWEHFLSNETVLSTQTLQNTKMGSQFLCKLFASKWEFEQMGIFLEFLVIGH